MRRARSAGLVEKLQGPRLHGATFLAKAGTLRFIVCGPLVPNLFTSTRGLRQLSRGVWAPGMPWPVRFFPTHAVVLDLEKTKRKAEAKECRQHAEAIVRAGAGEGPNRYTVDGSRRKSCHSEPISLPPASTPRLGLSALAAARVVAPEPMNLLYVRKGPWVVIGGLGAWLGAAPGPDRRNDVSQAATSDPQSSVLIVGRFA